MRNIFSSQPKRCRLSYTHLYTLTRARITTEVIHWKSNKKTILCVLFLNIDGIFYFMTNKWNAFSINSHVINFHSFYCYTKIGEFRILGQLELSKLYDVCATYLLSENVQIVFWEI